ncbi:YwmB family TATA-box binding protein [Heyndrickxia sp. NPDC080065]|uniref:YwmB family TATA-box binding protein n=1 Tax=Heyndrickxia sp. NPDC080065 TaxID=3390568 RepID=UPI003CFD93E8
MWKNTLVLVIIAIVISLSYGIVGKKSVSAKVSSDLELLADEINRQSGKITEWSLYTREAIDVSSKTEWINQVESFKQQFPNMKWNEFTKGNQLTLEGYFKEKRYVETIKFLSTPTKKNYPSYLIYEIKGTHWNKKIAVDINEKIGSKLDALYIHKPVIFSCIKGEFSDKIDKVLLSEMNHLLTSLNAHEKEALKEKDFYSISAYSKKLLQSIPTKDNQMNLQIGLRKTGLGANTSFVIGTPIITIEY